MFSYNPCGLLAVYQKHSFTLGNNHSCRERQCTLALLVLPAAHDNEITSFLLSWGKNKRGVRKRPPLTRRQNSFMLHDPRLFWFSVMRPISFSSPFWSLSRLQLEVTLLGLSEGQRETLHPAVITARALSEQLWTGLSSCSHWSMHIIFY